MKTQNAIANSQSAKSKGEFYRIVNCCAIVFKVEAEDLMRQDRHREFVDARHAAWYIVREKLEWTYQRIADVFERDRVTVMAGISKIENMLSIYPEFERQINNIRNIL